MGRARFLSPLTVPLLVPLLMMITGLTPGCATIKKPCAQGGEPPRDKPFTGKLEKKQCEQVEKQGKTLNHGLYREWHANGKLALEGEYKLGARNGKWFEWDESGKLLSERWFEDGKEVPTRAQAAQKAPETKK